MTLLRLHEEMRQFEQLAGYELVQSEHDVEVDGDATQSDTQHNHPICNLSPMQLDPNL